MSFKMKALAALEAYRGNSKGLYASTVAGCIEVIRSIPENDGWISVKDSLPEEFVSVLVHIPGESPLPTVREACLARGDWCAKCGTYSQDEVSHWMPLPEPPKEEK